MDERLRGENMKSRKILIGRIITFRRQDRVLLDLTPTMEKRLNALVENVPDGQPITLVVYLEVVR